MVDRPTSWLFWCAPCTRMWPQGGWSVAARDGHRVLNVVRTCGLAVLGLLRFPEHRARIGSFHFLNSRVNLPVSPPVRD
jgi:hypothetical protein